MTTFRFFLFFFLGTALLACTETDAPKKEMKKDVVIDPANPFAGTVYFFAPKLDKVTCEVYGDCECCWDNVLFIDDYRFIRIYYCEADRNYRRGTYSIKNDSIFMIYNSLEIEQELNWDWEDDAILDTTIPGGFTYRIEPLEELLDTLTPVLCNGQRRLKTGSEDIFYGQPDIIKPLKEYLKEIKADSIAERLDLAL